MGIVYGVIDGNYNKTRDHDQAQINKFEHAIETLRTKKGDELLDVGCG